MTSRERRDGLSTPVDAGAVILLTMCALVPYLRIFEPVSLIFSGLSAALFGVGVMELNRWRSWSRAMMTTIVVAVFLAVIVVFGRRTGPLDDGILSVSTLRSTIVTCVEGWRQLVALPPLQADRSSGLFVLPVACAFASGAAGWWLVVTRPLTLVAGSIPAVLVFAIGIFCGPAEPGVPIHGVLFVAMIVVWAALRFARRGPHHGVSSVDRDRHRPVLVSCVVAGVAVTVTLGTAIAVSTEPVVWRDLIQDPLDVEAMPTPLGYYRDFVKALDESVLFDVEGLEAGALVRMVALDDFDGNVWGIRSSVADEDRSGFQVVSSVNGGETAPGAQRASVTFSFPPDSAYREVWLPTVGEVRSFRPLAGEPGSDLLSRVRYDDRLDSAVLAGGALIGSAYAIDAIVPPTIDSIDPATSLEVESSTPTFVIADSLRQLSDPVGGDREIDVGSVVAIRDQLRAGFYSDASDDHVRVPAGHGLARLVQFADATNLVGNAEQYASAMAVSLRDRGARVRVVVGFVVGRNDVGVEVPAGSTDRRVRGADAEAWVEVDVTGYGWIPVLPTPDRGRTTIDTEGPAVPRPAREREIPPGPPPILAAPAADPIEQSSSPVPVPAPERPAEPPLTSGSDGRVGWPIIMLLVATTLIVVAALAVAVVALWKSLRWMIRRRASFPADRVANGWDELVDCWIDLGRRVPREATRSETATYLRSGAAVDLARRADRASYGPDAPSQEEADRYLRDIATERGRAFGALSRGARWRRRMSLASIRRSQEVHG